MNIDSCIALTPRRFVGDLLLVPVISAVLCLRQLLFVCFSFGSMVILASWRAMAVNVLLLATGLSSALPTDTVGSRAALPLVETKPNGQSGCANS